MDEEDEKEIRLVVTRTKAELPNPIDQSAMVVIMNLNQADPRTGQSIYCQLTLNEHQVSASLQKVPSSNELNLSQIHPVQPGVWLEWTQSIRDNQKNRVPHGKGIVQSYNAYANHATVNDAAFDNDVSVWLDYCWYIVKQPDEQKKISSNTEVIGMSIDDNEI